VGFAYIVRRYTLRYTLRYRQIAWNEHNTHQQNMCLNLRLQRRCLIGVAKSIAWIARRLTLRQQHRPSFFYFRSAMDLSLRTVLLYAVEAVPFTIGLTARVTVLSLIFVLKTSVQGLAFIGQLLGHIFLLLWEGWDAPMFAKQRTRTYRPRPYASSTGTFDLRRGH